MLFVGRQPLELVARYMTASDVVLFPSVLGEKRGHWSLLRRWRRAGRRWHFAAELFPRCWGRMSVPA